MPTKLDIETRLRLEVEAVHDFIKAWFTGKMPNESRTFEKRFATRMAPDMSLIPPSGRIMARDPLLQSIYMGYGSNEAFDIDIRDFQIRHISNDSHLVIATYIEQQYNANNTTPPDNERITTVLFQIKSPSHAPLWLHIHETTV